jgi:DNA-binding transcriptional MerR regulator
MFGVGAFARLAGVSIRTLHHYDEIGLLRPAHVDPGTGYRWYRAEQLFSLNRILALRDLGFALEDIGPIVDDAVSLEELRGMLRLRQVEARERLASEATRLARVEDRLRQIEREDHMSEYDIVVKALEPLCVAVRMDTTGGFDDRLGEIVPRLFAELYGELGHQGVKPVGPGMALYEDSGDESAAIRVLAAVPIDGGAATDLAVRDLRAVPRAATTIHRGSMARCQEGYEALLQWADATGERIWGYSREVYLDCDGPPEAWVTELQFVLAGEQ